MAHLVSPRADSRPRFVPPQLATLVTRPPEGSDWVHEVKYDGYRMACLLDGGKARLLTRRGLDWTARFPAVAGQAARLGTQRALLDGEIVVLLPDGRTSFQALQQALTAPNPAQLVYYVFDLLRLGRRDLRGLPLLDRKQELAALLRSGRSDARKTLRYSEHVVGSGAGVLAQACAHGLEGIVSKRSEAPYQSGRSRNWLKAKCQNRQEFVVLGFTEPRGTRQGLGALLLGVYDGKRKLQYAGKVGTGMGAELLVALRSSLEPLRRSTAPISGAVPRGLGRATWVEPRLVVEVIFTEWTADGRLRHPSLVGIRSDKPARQVKRELPA